MGIVARRRGDMGVWRAARSIVDGKSATQTGPKLNEGLDVVVVIVVVGNTGECGYSVSSTMDSLNGVV